MTGDPSSTGACGWMIKRCLYPDAEAVAVALAGAITEFLARPSDAPIALMLPGGRTPKAAYTLAASRGVRIQPNQHIAVSDERHVPAGDPGSNALMMKPFLEGIACPASQALFVDTSLPREAAASDFGAKLDRFFSSGGVLDTCFLGLGADGHTASLFRDSDLESSEGRSAIDVDRPDGRVGISASPTVIRRARRVVFVVTGEDKRDMADALLHEPRSIVAGKIVERHPKVELWLDAAAAGSVPK